MDVTREVGIVLEVVQPWDSAGGISILGHVQNVPGHGPEQPGLALECSLAPGLGWGPPGIPSSLNPSMIYIEFSLVFLQFWEACSDVSLNGSDPMLAKEGFSGPGSVHLIHIVLLKDS